MNITLFDDNPAVLHLTGTTAGFVPPLWLNTLPSGRVNTQDRSLFLNGTVTGQGATVEDALGVSGLDLGLESVVLGPCGYVTTNYSLSDDDQDAGWDAVADDKPGPDDQDTDEP